MKLFNDELVEGILNGYKDYVKQQVIDNLGKGSWGPRELEWFVHKLTTATMNIESLLESLAAKQELLDKTEVLNDERTTEEDKPNTEGDRHLDEDDG